MTAQNPAESGLNVLWQFTGRDKPPTCMDSQDKLLQLTLLHRRCIELQRAVGSHDRAAERLDCLQSGNRNRNRFGLQALRCTQLAESTSDPGIHSYDAQ